MLNHSRSRPDPRCCSPLLLHGHAHAAAEPPTEPRGMDPPSSSGGPATPRRQLQGPRPPRLNVRMESHAIKKPSASAAPAPGGQAGRRGDQQPLHAHTQQQQNHQQPAPAARAPVIIYDTSPKVIHAKPSEFMALVQRLTGPGGSGAAPPPADAQQERHHMDIDADDDDSVLLLGQAASSSFLPPELLLSPSAAMSPAARLATIERSVRPMPSDDYGYGAGDLLGVPGGGGGGADDDGTLAAALGPARHHHGGILSPLPSSLPPAAASGLFSPQPFDPACISWLNELSPILRAASAAGASPPAAPAGSRAPPPPPAYYSDPFVPSPRNSLLATPTVPSPATCADFFGSLPDL